jgi:5-methylcytosine-specific restriction enzyme A
MRHDLTGCSPAAVLRPCSTSGCPELTHGGPCEQHRRARQREHDKRRGTSTERGYDAIHCRLRILCFQRDEWRCVDCGWEPDIVKQCRELGLDPPPADQIVEELRRAFARGERHLHADHEIPIADRPDLRLDLDNLRTRCDGCHRAKTRRESVPTRTGRGESITWGLKRPTNACRSAGIRNFLRKFR